ncbi:hypothetical protein PLANPX_1619 [Lacipirellula parvula]|uniref:Uncharacterized protein n=2 Tax=Lacipirellula parvula TaxID=2650471 RepID=A0A5K7X870_9BACT|nr:hypothetical protein PLANPX_1619 [Lacipirellula parvula]
MLEELRWKTSPAATALYVAACRASGVAATDGMLAAALATPADALIAEIDATGLPRTELLAEITSLAAEFENNRELVTRAAARLHAAPLSSPTATRIAGAVGELEAALGGEQPNLAEELAARVRPLREQWEARGPGMLREIGRLTDEAIVPSAAEIVIVLPYAGGRGLAHPRQNRITLEGVLVHPHPQLPEPLRIAWLLAQLNSDLPRYADALPPGRSAFAFAVALAPATLAAAQEVELATCDEPALGSAFEAWGLSGSLPADAPQRVFNWWNAWLDGAATWPVAVAALERLLA